MATLNLTALFRAALLASVLFPTASLANCRQALALGLDVSGSVDAQEYRLQLDGLARALEGPQVRGALLATPENPVHLAVYEWSGPQDQRLIADWTAITDMTTLELFTNHLRQTNRTPANPSTALGSALRFGAALLDLRSDCWTQTLDISGDGESNTGPRPQDVDVFQGGDITVNGLVIGADSLNFADQRQVQIGQLSSYFSAYVIRGPGAFVETAIGFEDYESAMTRKLLRELQSFAIGSATLQTQSPLTR